jgi:hypothetical protein
VRGHLRGARCLTSSGSFGKRLRLKLSLSAQHAAWSGVPRLPPCNACPRPSAYHNAHQRVKSVRQGTSASPALARHLDMLFFYIRPRAGAAASVRTQGRLRARASQPRKL